jgi:hypothetical protein
MFSLDFGVHHHFVHHFASLSKYEYLLGQNKLF